MDELAQWHDLARGLKKVRSPEHRRRRSPVRTTISSKRYELIVEFHNNHHRAIRIKALAQHFDLLHQLRKTAQATAERIVQERDDVEYISIWEMHRTLIGRITKDDHMYLSPEQFVEEVA